MRRGIGRLRAGGSGFSPLSLFAAGEQGVWYSPDDFSTLFQDSAGTTPVTAVGQPVGLLLDKHAGLARGASIITNGDFASGLTGWSQTAGYTASGGGALYTSAGAGAQNLSQTGLSIPAGTTWEVLFDVTAVTGGCVIQAALGGAESGGNVGTVGPKSCLLTAAAARTSVIFSANGSTGSTIAIDNVVVRQITGNHATQATTTMRALAATGGGETFDGVDDADATTSGGGSTTGFFYCASLTVNGGAATARTLWSDTGTNTGYRVRINASNQLELAAGNGTAYTTVATSGTLSVGTTYVVTAWHDGVNLNVQINKGTAASTAFGSVSAGTAGFTEAKDNGGTTSPASVTLFSRVYRQTVPTAAQIANTQTFVGAKAGLSL